MDKCPNCGNKLSNIDVLCPKCGAVVEVIQVKNISLASETAADSKTKNTDNIQKKDFTQNFIVYNEDFPTEDNDEKEPAIVTAKTSDEIIEQPEKEYSSNPSNELDFDPVKLAADSLRGKRFENTYADNEDFPVKNKSTSASNEYPGISLNEDENDYSPRYLENLKKLNLPAIDDISSFDPEEFMREYKYKKILSGQTSSYDSPAPAKKQWLEIEETGTALADELVRAKEDVQMQAAAPPVIERRYKGTQESRMERKQESVRAESRQENVFAERKQENIYAERKQENVYAERKQENVYAESTQPTVKDKKPRKSSVLSMLLFWIVISAAILFSCIFFDNYVKYSKGTYDSFIFSITNGQIDIDPNNN